MFVYLLFVAIGRKDIHELEDLRGSFISAYILSGVDTSSITDSVFNILAIMGSLGGCELGLYTWMHVLIAGLS